MDNNNQLTSYLKKQWKSFQVLRESNEYIAAFVEFSIIYIVSNIPFIALVVIYNLTTKGAETTVDSTINIIVNNVRHGELIIYISVLLAPLVYVMVQYNRLSRHLPLYTVLLMLTAIIYLYSLLVFAFDRLSMIENWKFVTDYNVYIYILALFMWYASLVLDRKLKRPTLYDRPGAKDIIDELEKDSID